MMTYYKYLNADGTSCNGGSGKWHLPVGRRPGKWMPRIADIVPCRRGYHVCRADDLLAWRGETLWEVEVRGTQVLCIDKVVVAQARVIRRLRWNDRVARLYACDCAERALGRTKCTDRRLWDAIIVSRRFAYQQATREELDAARAAAWDAACDAAWDAARDAARDAAWAAAWDATWDAARDAAWAAAGAAAGGAARDAERAWQTSRLLAYLYGEVDISVIPTTEMPR